MAINYNSNPIYHIKKDSLWVKELNYGGNIVWEETYGTYTVGTAPTGVASVTCSRTSTKEPTASTGTLASGTTVYNNDVILVTMKGSGWYGISFSGSPTSTGYDTTSITLSTPVPSASTREQTFDPYTHFSNYVIDERMVTLGFQTGLYSLKVNYGNPDTHAMTSVTKYADWDFTAYNGWVITWTATASSGYELEEVSGTERTGAARAIIAPTPRAYAWKEICPTWLGSGRTLNLTSFTSDKATGNGWTFGGLANYKQVRVSGTYTVKDAQLGLYSKTGSFSDVVLSTDSSTATELFNATISRTYNQRVYFSLVTVTATKDDLLGIIATRSLTSSYISVGYVQITITSIQAYLPFDESDLEVDFSDNMLYFYVGKCFDSRCLYLLGDVDYSSYYFSQTTFKKLGTNREADFLSTEDIVDDASAEQELTSASCAFAIADATTNYVLSPMRVLEF